MGISYVGQHSYYLVKKTWLKGTKNQTKTKQVFKDKSVQYKDPRN